VAIHYLGTLETILRIAEIATLLNTIKSRYVTGRYTRAGKPTMQQDVLVAGADNHHTMESGN
jgi:hypothetical protein